MIKTATKIPGFIGHCRVSSSRQVQEGDSLQTQGEIVKRIGESNGWELKHPIWFEGFSGRKIVRPIFNEILEFIDENPGEVQYYVFKSIDRVTRAGASAYEQMKRDLSSRGVQMIDSMGIIQPMKNSLEDTGFEYTWSRNSPSEISEVVMATSSKQVVSEILTRLIRQEISLTQAGFKVRAPHDGYLNERTFVAGKKRTIQVIDPQRGKYIIAMFELRASGIYTDKEIVQKINAMGYRTKEHNKWSKDHTEIIGKNGGKELTVKKMQSLIIKPIYCGIVVEKWTKYKPIKAQYEGLVSIETFNQANKGKVYIQSTETSLEILYNVPSKTGSRRLKNNPLFPYKFIRCNQCHKPFCGSSPKGKSGKTFPTYHCARNHKYVGFKKEIFDEYVECFFTSLEFEPDILNSLHAVLLDRYRERQGEIMETASEVGHNVAELELQKAQAVKSFIATTSAPLRKGIEEEIEKLDKEINKAQEERNKLEITEKDIDLFIKEAKTIMEHPDKMLLNPSNPKQQEALLGLVFEEIPTFNEIINGTPKLTWIFKLSSEFRDKQSRLVCLVSTEPDTTRPHKGYLDAKVGR